MTGSLSSYGAVSATNEEGVGAQNDKIYDSTNTYYLKDKRQPWTIRKFIVLLVPLLGAALLLAGAVWYLLSDFNHLYPGHYGVGSDSRSSYDVPTSKVDPFVLSSSSAHQKSIPENPQLNRGTGNDRSDIVHDSENSNCAAHQACSSLLGDCCPTLDGIILECCS